MSLTSSTDLGGTRTRTRTRPAAFKIDMPKAEHFVALRRGISYHLGGEHDITFRRGLVKEVSEQVYRHLSTNAYDIVSHEDPDCGRVRRKVRKFSFSPELPEELEVSYHDLDGSE
jgi:hypothetical protein